MPPFRFPAPLTLAAVQRHGVLDTLAAAFGTPGLATDLLRRAAWHATSLALDEFAHPRFYWEKVIEPALGRGDRDLRRLLAAAAEAYPYNPAFGYWAGLTTAQRPPPPGPGDRPRATLLFLAAGEVPAYDKLDSYSELEEILGRLSHVGARVVIDVIPFLGVHPGAFLDAIVEFQPAVVHFSGHATPDGEVVMKDRYDVEVRLAPRDLEAILRAVNPPRRAAPPVRVVCLNACYSGQATGALKKHVEAVVGSTGPVADGAAGCFAGGFYHALSCGLDAAGAIGIAELHYQIRRYESGPPGPFEPDGPRFLGEPGCRNGRQLDSLDEVTLAP